MTSDLTSTSRFWGVPAFPRMVEWSLISTEKQDIYDRRHPTRFGTIRV